MDSDSSVLHVRVARGINVAFHLIGLILFIAALVVSCLKRNRSALGEKLRIQASAAFIIFIVLNLSNHAAIALQDFAGVAVLSMIGLYFSTVGVMFVVTEAAHLFEIHGNSHLPEQKRLLAFSLIGWCVPVGVMILTVITSCIIGFQCGVLGSASDMVWLVLFAAAVVAGLTVTVLAYISSKDSQERRGFTSPMVVLSWLLLQTIAEIALHGALWIGTWTVAHLYVWAVVYGLGLIIVPSAFLANRAARTKGEGYSQL